MVARNGPELPLPATRNLSGHRLGGGVRQPYPRRHNRWVTLPKQTVSTFSDFGCMRPASARGCDNRYEEIVSRGALQPSFDDLVAPGEGKVQGDLGRAVTLLYFVV